MSTWVKVTVNALEPDQLRPIAEIARELHDRWDHFGLLTATEVESSYAPQLVLFVNVAADHHDEAHALAKAAVSAARTVVERLLGIGRDGRDPLNSIRTVVDDQFLYDPGYRRIGQVFVRARRGAIGRVVSELEVPAQIIRGAVWSVAQGTSSRVVIPRPAESAAKPSEDPTAQ
jgi:hypothetical protein